MDLVLDGMGGEVLLKSLEVVREGGTINSLPTPQFPEEVTEQAEKRNINLSFLMVQSNGEDMNTLMELLADRTLKAHVSKTFLFSETGKAHLEMETGRTVGKVVVKI